MKQKIFLVCIGAAIAALVGCGEKAAAPQDQPKSQAPAINPAFLKVAQNLVLEDIALSAEGADAVTPKEKALHNLNIFLSVESKQLAREYDDNEVAADQKYKKTGSYLLVSGSVTGISKDFKGDPYVTLQGHQLLHDVQARFEKSDNSELASFKKGQHVLFVCEVSNKIMTQVMLRKCATLPAHAEAVRGNIDKYVAEVLAGKVKPSAEGADLISLGYVAAQNLPEGSPCFNDVKAEACVKQLTSTVGNKELQEKAKAMSAKLQGV